MLSRELHKMATAVHSPAVPTEKGMLSYDPCPNDRGNFRRWQMFQSP